MDITTFSLFLLPHTGDRNSIYSNRAVNKNAKETDAFMEKQKGDLFMKKVNANKKAVLTVLSAVFGVGSFVVNILTSKDETEEIAQRAAEILEEKKSANDEG